MNREVQLNAYTATHPLFPPPAPREHAGASVLYVAREVSQQVLIAGAPRVTLWPLPASRLSGPSQMGQIPARCPDLLAKTDDLPSVPGNQVGLLWSISARQSAQPATAQTPDGAVWHKSVPTSSMPQLQRTPLCPWFGRPCQHVARSLLLQSGFISLVDCRGDAVQVFRNLRALPPDPIRGLDLEHVHGPLIEDGPSRSGEVEVPIWIEA